MEGNKKGKKIAWRADMDAIKFKTNDTSKYHSKNKGIAHMCGHDVHTTIGLGIANVLSNQKENLAGTVYFIFQPSEETFTGAKDLVENGLFDIIDPDEIYGLHIDPAEKGTVNSKPKELFAYQKAIKIKLKSENNEKEIKSFLTDIIQGFVRNEPNTTPWSLDYLTTPQMGLENEGTIYRDYFILQYAGLEKKNDSILFGANFLETDKEKIDSIPLIIKRKILSSKFKSSFISTEYSGGNPTVYNDPELTKIALQTIDSLYDNKLTKPIYGQIPYFNEDFIYYQQKVPGVMFLLGGSNMEKGTISMPHTPDFTVDDETIKFGVKCFSSLVLERTNSK
ncbi:M20/M25/M40 family metallo-hydrolase [Flavivirga aquimarina]|uniref:M20/M25/M40 family metallo-hydrolase n=1 Tax=Flavivirga aquimarina TaxID=2027862 RepID=A0ABT8WDZ4_9FLAO|nr:M20/M25/M40 family metallo-hydrolase [Flavivirga aquimarina]